MAKLKFIGIAQSVSQIDVVTLGGTWAAGEKARLTINGKFVEYTAIVADTPALVAVGLAAAAAASTAGEFREIAFTRVTTTVIGTSIAGTPFTMTVSEDSASGTIGTSTTQAATGPNHWNNAANWSTAVVPTTADEVFVEASSVAIRYGFPTALVLAKFVQSAGAVGLPDTNSAGFEEYRAKYLTISAAIVSVDGGTLSRISTESVTSVITSQSRNAVDVKVNHATAQVHAMAGVVRVVPSDAETGQAATIRCAENARLEIGAGVTVGTVLSAGISTIRGTITTLTVEGGECKFQGVLTTANVKGGTMYYESGSTITTVNLSELGLFECRTDIRAKTVTTFNMTGGRLSNPHRVITFTNFQPDTDMLQAG